MYRITREAYEAAPIVGRDFSRKTAELVKTHTKGGQIKPTLDIYEINEDTLKQIQESSATDTEKVFNLLKSIAKAVREGLDIEPYLLGIGERAERIVELYKQGQKATEVALEALKALVEEINAARRERREKEMPVEVFSIYWVLRQEGIDNPKEQANRMRGVLEEYQHWRTSEAHERKVRQALYASLVRSGMSDTTRLPEVCGQVMRVLKAKSR